MKKFLKVFFILAVLGGAGYFGYQYYQGTQAAPAASVSTENAYARVAVRKGSLSKSVTGTGSLSISETQDVTVPYAVTVTGKLVSVGDVVEEGQGLLSIDKDALQTTIKTLQTELDTCEADMSAISGSYSSNAYVYAPLYGVFKEIYVEAGQKLQDVMKEKGCIALMSLDGRMYVDVPAAEGMAVSDKTKVKVGKDELDGVVREVEGGVARITFTDQYADEGQQVEVFYKQQSLGLTEAHISMPYRLTATDKGYVYAVYMEKNRKKWEGNRLIYLVNVPVSEEYQALEKTRQELTEKIAAAGAMLESGAVPAPQPGIVSSLVDPSLTEQTALATLASMYVGDKMDMVVSVDELDITHVQAGQSAEVAMDAVQGATYQATVSHVSQIGAPTSGVTVYDVTLDLEGDGRLKIGMNGTATIKVQEVSDALLVPMAALNSSREGQYVWVQDETLPEDSQEPGKRTMVTTGMSDDSFAQVLTGLAEGDVLLVTREAATGGSGGMNMMNMGGGMMFTMQGTPPSGGGNVRFEGGGGNRTGGGGGGGGGGNARPSGN